MKDQDLEEIFRKAAEISKVVPEQLREAAFNRAVDALLNTGVSSNQSGGKSRSMVPSASSKRPQTQEGASDEEEIQHLLQTLDRTAYPAIRHADKTLDRALVVLFAAQQDFNIDGLTAKDIARILTDKFRKPAKESAVRMALDRAGDKVDRVTRGGKLIFRIMSGGEIYLESLDKADDKGKENISNQGHPSKSSQKRLTSKKAVENGASSRPKKQRTLAGRPGPLAALKQLVIEGYFKTPRRISDIQDHLSHSKAHSYKATDLSPALVRMLRDGELKRERAADGQYEYKRS